MAGGVSGGGLSETDVLTLISANSSLQNFNSGYAFGSSVGGGAVPILDDYVIEEINLQTKRFNILQTDFLAGFYDTFTEYATDGEIDTIYNLTSVYSGSHTNNRIDIDTTGIAFYSNSIDLGYSINQEYWEIKFKFHLTSFLQGSANHTTLSIGIGASTTTNTSQDFAGWGLDVGTINPDTFCNWSASAQNLGQAPTTAERTGFSGIVTPTADTDYWIRIFRHGNNITVKMYSDAYSTEIATHTFTGGASITALRYLRLGAYTQGTGYIKGYIENYQFSTGAVITA